VNLAPAIEAEDCAPAMPSSFIVLSGFMGAGKSTVGPRLADALGMTFVDLDAEIVRRAGRSIAELFLTEGEAAFRGRESEALSDALSGAPAVVAVGGGAMLAPAHRALARSRGVLVSLSVSPTVSAQRIGADAALRPNFDADTGALAARHAARASAYADADVIIDTDTLDSEGVLAALRTALADRGVL
jgi:shikimate kinase